jgi:putative transposase
MSTVIQAYRFALDPCPAQEAALRSHCGGQRFAFNWGLARVKANLGQRRAEQSYGIPGDQLTPSLNWTAYSLRKDWNQAKVKSRRGGPRTARRRTRPVWPTSPPRWGTGTTRGKANGRVARSGFPGSRANALGCRAGSPPAPSASPPMIVGM